MLKGSLEQGGLKVYTEEGFYIAVTPEDSGNPLLGSARVEACTTRDGEELFVLTVFWQEVDERG